MITWAWSYVTYKRGARLITGLERPPVPFAFAPPELALPPHAAAPA
jgi:hypothetical protein